MERYLEEEEDTNAVMTEADSEPMTGRAECNTSEQEQCQHLLKRQR